MRKNRKYTDEFKRDAINLVDNSNKSKSEIARDLGISPSTMHSWLKKSVRTKDGNIITDSEITRLRKELADTKILKVKINSIDMARLFSIAIIKIF